MTPKKLTESDKQEIIQLYRSSPETTSTLADRYDVSTSTISRLLKASFTEAEYEALIQQKRSGRFQTDSTSPEEAADPVPEPVTTLESNLDSSPAQLGGRRQRRRSSAANEAGEPPQPEPAEVGIAVSPAASQDYTAGEFFKEILKEDLADQAEIADEEADDDDLDDDDEDLDDLDDDLDDELEDGEDDGSDLSELPPIQLQPQAIVQVLPLSEANIPKIFYLVVDRTAELITRPLRDFGVLGQIPAEEIQEKTLPIFDNHRVARRFSRKTQRVIKVPDGAMLQKVGPYLQAKGITRLLIDGQVYSLP